ncbi:class I SAM-dependent methyltransferase [Poseidonocella sedimentorum]|uniref:SAM-dependent methyltransferase, MidA family n=1 Tax=Poseidonocella sedimentorum TaxID=871652 RepID=A0A1I6E8T9_9RHOB|nr:SAM-dependent methyltransferase [Poseidonocella sedimentorum]SFR13982.1 SAM-dependent methyltransferase, MidA family [Poseidonocella sedimentorum]
MSPLEEHLHRRIAFDGPLTVAAYMQTCLLHPEHGYYTTRQPIGAEGDFTTAPEISQMFGELVGLALAQSWLDQGAPEAFTLAELGPGRGVLMADALRATRGVPGFHAALRLHLVEVSPPLRAVQSAALAGFDPVFHESAESLPEEAPLLVIANEFFDALPVRQFLRSGAGWCERLVGVSDGRLSWGLSPPGPQPELDHRLAGSAEGDMVSWCPAGARIAAEIGRRITARGGAALIIDYGDWRATGDSLQAIHAREKAPPLAHPGAADLTAHVSFEDLARAAPCAHSGPVPQGVFLEALGITARARSLAGNAGPAAADAVAAAHRRLTHPGEMGSLFKVLALHSPDAPPPPGLAS